MNHDAICARLPHAGRMCLLERLESWDGDSIICIATSHRDTDNPLRSGGHLHAVAGVEYAAQAMALHGNLLSSTDTPTAMDGGSAGREAVPTGTNAGAVFRPIAKTASIPAPGAAVRRPMYSFPACMSRRRRRAATFSHM